MSTSENNRFIVQVYVGALSAHYEALSVEASKQTTSEEIVACIVERLALSDSPNSSSSNYELAEVVGDAGTEQECKERRIGANECPVALMLLWPKTQQESYRFYLREKLNDMWSDNFAMDPQLIKDYFYRFLYQPKDREYPDLCQLPDLNEQTLLDNLRARFNAGHIYTYVGSILIAVNPFKFHPIYNPKYVKLYQNTRLRNLPPHIFAVADSAYHSMLKERKNQCIVISGESGSGKTESTNFLLHHLTALSQKGSHGSGVEQTILSAGPVLEAFGNAKTAHNNNSSRFGKFIQVNYKENGMVHGAVVQKYLLEKSRICSQGRNERNYHVFYYLLAGASEQERQLLHLKTVEQYNYLNRSGCYILENIDEKHEFSRLKQSMEMVGFTAEKQRRLFSVLSSVLLLGNVEFIPRKSVYHHDEAVAVKNRDVVNIISQLLRVKQETLLAALTAKTAKASGETLIINYRLPEAIAARDAMAKCLYGALFDWIVMQVNHALLSKKDTLRDHQGNSIGVLDIFGFEDFGLHNSFEQLCINYANEHLQYYFNQHVFKYEQEEYRKEGIRWTNIEFMDNTGCLQLIEGKPNGLLCLLDDQCNFPGATNETLLQKFNTVHKDSIFYEKPQRREAAFLVRHYAGKVKYQVTEMREKNLDLMRQDIVGVLKNSSMAFVRELVGADPVAVFRWAIVRAFFRGYFAFHEAGRKHRQARNDNPQFRYKNHVPNDNIISKQRNTIFSNRDLNKNAQKYNDALSQQSGRLSWPQQMQRNRSNSAIAPILGTTATTSAQKAQQMRRESTGSCTTKTASSIALERVLCPDEARVMHRANQIVMKNKSFRPRERGKKGLKNLETVKTLAGRAGLSNSYLTAATTSLVGATTATNAGGNAQMSKARKQPLTVTAQFQHSLHSLMETLNQANPFFIRCIKSNAEKIPNKFDEETVQRQLRYTGMLETVRIRQAGFNVRLSYDEFIQLYRILLPKGLLSSQSDVRHFLATLNLNRDNYQMGDNKVFLRESEKVKLDYKLHQQIMASIVAIQRWFRSCLERRRYLNFRNAVVKMQSFWRMFRAQKAVAQLKAKWHAAVVIQAQWRGFQARRWYQKLFTGVRLFQAHARGYLVRKCFVNMKLSSASSTHRLSSSLASNRKVQIAITGSGTFSTDEAFASRESSQDELDKRIRDSDESSGILEDGGDLESNDSRTNLHLRPTLSLPSVGPLNTLNVSPITRSHESNEGTLLDVNTYGKKRLSKTYRSVDLSELDSFDPTRRKSSVDNVLKSFDTLAMHDTMTASTRDSLENTRRNLQVIINSTSKAMPLDKMDTNNMKNVTTANLRVGDARYGPVGPSSVNLGQSHLSGSAILPLNDGTYIASPAIATSSNTLPKTSSSNLSESVWKIRPEFEMNDLNNPYGHSQRQVAHAQQMQPRQQPPKPVLPNDIVFTSNGSFMLAGHWFHKVTRYTKDPILCDYCFDAMDAYDSPGFTCVKCEKRFHARCIHDRIRYDLPCSLEYSGTSTDSTGRQPYINPPNQRNTAGTEMNYLLSSRGQESMLKRGEIKTLADGLISCPPVRRNNRNIAAINVDTSVGSIQAPIKIGQPRVRINIDSKSASSDSAIVTKSISNDARTRDDMQVKGGKQLPEVPVRTVRKPKRGENVTRRSMGGVVDDQLAASLPVEARNTALLDTIGETNAPNTSASSKYSDISHPVWSQRKNVIRGNTEPYSTHDADIPSPPRYATPVGKRMRPVTTLELRRRNSDPATKINEPLKLLSNNDEIEFKSPTSFNIAGHRFRKITRFAKDDVCVYCHEQMDAFLTQGHKCVDCKQLFHTKCIQNRGVFEIACALPNVSAGSSADAKAARGRNNKRKHSRTPYDIAKQVTSKFSLTGTSEFTDSTDKIISDARELQLMESFIADKIFKIETEEVKNEGKKPSEVDRVFKQALREFKDNLIQTYSVAHKTDTEVLNVKYKDLIANFLHVMEGVCKQEQVGEDFPVTMGVNAFRGFMNEFMSSEKPSKIKRKKEKKRKPEDLIYADGHMFQLTIINIPTQCEICQVFFFWPLERGLVCQTCKLTCHKKCRMSVSPCGKDPSAHHHRLHITGHHHGAIVSLMHNPSRVFGVPLSQLLVGEYKVPAIIDRLITTIEMYGLYIEGLYRKSGASSKVKELKLKMDEQEDVNFENYQVHVLASVLKSFLRQLPEPLLTFDFYDDFIRAANLTDEQDRVCTLFGIIKKLPKANFDLMERLIFHLARVAMHEDSNKMSSKSLAIVFAPCILRTNKIIPAQDSLQDINQQTCCVHTIIAEQLRKVRATLADIDTLDTACHTATNRLSSLRSSKVFSPEELLLGNSNAPSPTGNNSQNLNNDNETSQIVLNDDDLVMSVTEDEEALLVGHIQEIQKEKALLTSTLPSLTRATSDDDLLSTDLDGEGSMDDISCGTPSSLVNPSAAQHHENSHKRGNPNIGANSSSSSSAIGRVPVIRSISSSGFEENRRDNARMAFVTSASSANNRNLQMNQMSQMNQSGHVIVQKSMEDDAPIMV